MLTREDEWLQDVQHYMTQVIELEPGPIVPLVKEHLSSGGKLIRPRLIFKVVELAGGDPRDAREWAAAIELLHNATLIHDDYQDGDTHRRGQPTVWMKYGGAQAINAGDYLWSTAFQAVAGRNGDDSQTLALIRLLSDMAMEVVQGQALELSSLSQDLELRTHYFDIIKGKTSGLFRIPAKGSLLMAGEASADGERLSEYFEELGLLFQLQDDLLDLYGDKGRSGVGEDLREGKLSFLIVKHVETHPDQRAECLDFLSRPREAVGAEDVEQWIRKFREDGTLEAALEEFCQRETGLLSSLRAELPKYEEIFSDLLSVIKNPISHLFA